MQIAAAAADCVRSHEALGDTENQYKFLHILGSSQLLSDDYEGALQTADILCAALYVQADPVLKAKSEILRAAAWRNLAHHESAIETSRQALKTLAAVHGASRIRAEAYQGLIASLVEAGQIEKAWELREPLVEVLAETPDNEFSGQCYWTLGNLAFAHGQNAAGLDYHERAAGFLKLVNKIHVWARFNKASADVQLQAGVANNQTNDCIERAELAYAILGGTTTELAGLATTKARWLLATEQLEQAVEILEKTILESGVDEALDIATARVLLAQVRTIQGL
ncbi:hypothetical protein [Paeniglutamicibacter antarcticus]|uniref:Tetratricopeptide repeat protein n=1 Tax=Paeniglutamicibacter antarcticus TaxID=494023 RepID=A0ABP9TTQ6_9MICC